MATASAAAIDSTSLSCDLRDWLKEVKRLEQLEQISGAHWDLEIGALTEIILERIATPPAVIFDNVPGFDPKRRVLANMLETLERTALTLNLPLDLKTIPLIDALRARSGLGWISALRSGSIRELMNRGHLQLSLFDQQNAAVVAEDIALHLAADEARGGADHLGLQRASEGRALGQRQAAVA